MIQTTEQWQKHASKFEDFYYELSSNKAALLRHLAKLENVAVSPDMLLRAVDLEKNQHVDCEHKNAASHQVGEHVTRIFCPQCGAEHIEQIDLFDQDSLDIKTDLAPETAETPVVKNSPKPVRKIKNLAAIARLVMLLILIPTTGYLVYANYQRSKNTVQSDVRLTPSPPLSGKVNRLITADNDPAQDLNAYSITQMGANVDSQRKQLIIHTRVKNTSRLVQPLPRLRVSLKDRNNQEVDQHDLDPDKYMPTITQLIAGQDLAVDLVMPDPGDAAVGFEIMACIKKQSQWQCQ